MRTSLFITDATEIINSGGVLPPCANSSPAAPPANATHGPTGTDTPAPVPPASRTNGRLLDGRVEHRRWISVDWEGSGDDSRRRQGDPGRRKRGSAQKPKECTTGDRGHCCLLFADLIRRFRDCVSDVSDFPIFANAKKIAAK
jgi:hypothetical protein